MDPGMMLGGIGDDTAGIPPCGKTGRVGGAGAGVQSCASC
jgi:hypothetical protein